jgi:hypothetical protein
MIDGNFAEKLRPYRFPQTSHNYHYRMMATWALKVKI